MTRTTPPWPGEIDRHALEVEALLDLAPDLVERVAQFLLVEVADDVTERRVERDFAAGAHEPA